MMEEIPALDNNKKQMQGLQLSVIVPAYNVSEYLKKCVESLLNQDLSKYEYEIIAIEHFDTVVEDCLRENADLILLDINLPLYDGYYVCRAIREKSEVPIIVVTSRDSEMDELMSMNLGADDFVTKPYNTQILLARISAMLKRTRKEEVENSVQYHGLKLQLNNSMVVYEDQVIELS